MVAIYKKRAKSGYNSDKKLSNKVERTVINKEIQEHLSDESKIKAKTLKSKVNKEDLKIKDDLLNLKLAIKNSNGKGLKGLLEKSHNKNCTFLSGHYSSLYSNAIKSIPYLKKALDTTISNKVKKQIKDLLDKA